MYGLKDSDLDDIIGILRNFPEVEEGLIYGSRAKGNYKRGSDVDIALKGSGLSYSIVGEISFLLNEETLMPYFFDVLNYHSLDNMELRDHIDRVGRLIYQRSEVDVIQEPMKKYRGKKGAGE